MASAALLASLAALPAAAQVEEGPLPAPGEDGAAPPAAVDPAGAGASESAPGDPAAAKQTQIDMLFKELANPDTPHWQVVQDQIFRQWRKSGSASMDLLLDRALTAIDKGDLDTALLHLNDLVRLDPSFAEGWNQRATVYFLKGDYGRAVADIEHVLVLEPRHFGALAGLGIILDRAGNEKGALAVYRRVLEINPHMEGAKKGVERLAPTVDGRDL